MPRTGAARADRWLGVGFIADEQLTSGAPCASRRSAASKGRRCGTGGVDSSRAGSDNALRYLPAVSHNACEFTTVDVHQPAYLGGRARSLSDVDERAVSRGVFQLADGALRCLAARRVSSSISMTKCLFVTLLIQEQKRIPPSPPEPAAHQRLLLAAHNRARVRGGEAISGLGDLQATELGLCMLCRRSRSLRVDRERADRRPHGGRLSAVIGKVASCFTQAFSTFFENRAEVIRIHS